MLPTHRGGSHSQPPQREREYIDAIRAEVKARAHSQGMPLRTALASKSALFATSAGRQFYLVEEWTFTYAKSDEQRISIAVTAAEVDDQRSVPGFTGPVSEWPEILNWRINSDEACALAERYGATPGGGPFGGAGLFKLRAADVDGLVAPIWLLPYRLMGRPIYIRADTGAAVFLRDYESFLLTQTAPRGKEI